MRSDFNPVVDNMTIEKPKEHSFQWLTQLINHISDREKITIEKLNEPFKTTWFISPRQPSAKL